MKNLKKWILSALCATCAFAGVATLQGNQEVATASAAVATEYETVDTAMWAKIHNEYIPNGNFSLYILIPELDMGGKTGSVSFAANLAEEFNKLGFFDNVKIAGKTLREYGCTSFYNNAAVGFNEKITNEVPHNHIRLYCHADPEIWAAAHNSGEVSFTSDVTIAEGTLIPGYAYLNGDEDATLYRAGCEFVTTASTANYGVTSYGETDILSMEYVQGHDGNKGYLGVSLKGDDYLGDGQQVEINQIYKDKYTNFTSTIELNGLSEQTGYYGLYNLGEAGKGYYSFQVDIHEDELETITVPAGTLFPARGLDGLPAVNTLEDGGTGYPLIVYRTQTTQTFYKTEDGKYLSVYAYTESAKAELTDIYNAKVADCFAEDKDTLDSAYATAQAALESVTTIEEIDAAYTAAKAVFDVVLTKAETIEAAKAELDAYKAEDGYYRDAEKASRDGFIAEAKATLDGATTKEAIESVVAAAKTKIDALKTAAQYADEELADDKAAARAEINGYKANESYLEEQAAEYEAAIEAGLAAVAAAKNEAEIAAAVEGVKTAVDALETKGAIYAAAKAELNEYKAEEGLYRDAQATERADIIKTAEENIEKATTQAAVAEVVTEAKAAIDLLKTDAELTQEEKDAANEALAKEKVTAIEKINEIKASVDYSKYSAENQAVINNLYKTAKGLVEDAMSEEEVNAAVETFKNELAEVPQKNAGNTDNNANDVPVDDDANALSGIMNQLGCNAVVGASSVMALTVALGAVLFTKKRKED